MWTLNRGCLSEGRNPSLLQPQQPIRGLLWVSGEGAVKGTEAESATMDENHRQLWSPSVSAPALRVHAHPPTTCRCAGPQAGAAAPRALCSLLEPTPSPSRLSAGNQECSWEGTHLLGHFENFQRSRAHRSPLPAYRTQCDLRGKRLHFSSCGVHCASDEPTLTTLGSHLRAATRHWRWYYHLLIVQMGKLRPQRRGAVYNQCS